MTTVLVIDDVAPMAEQYAYDLTRIAGYDTVTAASGDAGLDVLRHRHIDCVILDLEMPGIDGFQVLRTMGRREIDVPVIVYTGTGNYDRCVEAVKLGAYGFIDKTEPMERVVHEIETVLERHRLRQEVDALRENLDGAGTLIGATPPMQALREAIARIAPIPSPVLIVGESGSGKELVARAIHRQSQVANGPFVALNSAALPENLVESELFGHERGAFTGADRQRKGAFEAAAKGTLFLDEIGELPLPAQAKLLRVLEERTLARVGGTNDVEVTARVLAATNRSLEEEIIAGRFRQDLYYRINVHLVRVPPLRDRLADVPELVAHLLAVTCRRYGIKPKRLATDAVQALMAYDWRRNNVRELRNVIERMVIATDGDVIGAAHVPPEIDLVVPAIESDDSTPEPRTFQEQKTHAERRIIIDALERNQWRIGQTARELGLSDHASLLKIMRRHGLVRGVKG